MLVYILALGLILRLVGISESFWLDEATTANVVRQFSLNQIITQFSPGDFHPPLYYLILKVYSSFLGTSEIALRSFSVLCGTATIAVIYQIGKKLGDRSGGTLAALLLATSPLAIYYSGEARMYALSAFFVSLAILAFVKISKKVNSKWWLIFILSSLASYLTLYPTIFMIPVFLISSHKKKFLIVQAIILGLLVITILPVFLSQLHVGLNAGTLWGSALGDVSIKNLALIPVKFLIGRIGFENKLIYLCYLSLGVILFSLGLIRARKHKFLWYWIIVPILLAVIISLKLPMLSYFRFLFVLPAFYLLCALGLQKLKAKYFLPAVIAVLSFNLISVYLYFNQDRFHRENWKGMVETIKQESGDKSYKLIFPKNSQMEVLEYYWPQSNHGGGAEEVEEGLDQIWYVRYAIEIVDPIESARSKIEGMGYKKQEEFDFRGVNVWKYAKL